MIYNFHFFIDRHPVWAIRSWKASKCGLHLLLLQWVYGERKNSFPRSPEFTNTESQWSSLPNANIHINQQPRAEIAHFFIPSSTNRSDRRSSALKNRCSWWDKRYSSYFDFRCNSLFLRKHDVLCGVLLEYD